MQNIILTIAGSDSGGGAGAQGDIKTITCLGGYAMSVITAITAQNSFAVDKIYALPADIINAQLNSIMNDVKPDIIKIGMLFNNEIIDLVIKFIKKYPDIKTIIDPVMVATSGAVLLQAEALDNLIKNLLPLAEIITPNISEAELITGDKINSVDDMIKSAKKIKAQKTAKNILIKGGHLDGDKMTDVLLTANDEISLITNDKINSKNTHGTGCSLASAIATYMNSSENLKEAVLKANKYVYYAILQASLITKGPGPVNHLVKNLL